MLRKLEHPPSDLRSKKHSVVRRSLRLSLFTFPGIILNLGLLYVATILLDRGSFGIFYLSITLVNILFAPSLIINLFYIRTFIEHLEKFGQAAATLAIKKIIGIVARWAVCVALLAFAPLFFFGERYGLHPWVSVLIVAIVLSSYIADCLRVAFQGMHQFSTLGMYSLSWMGLRFVFGVVGILIFHSAVGGLSGILISAPVIFLVFYLHHFRLGSVSEAGNTTVHLPSIARIAPLGVSYAIFTVLIYHDIVLAYLLLDTESLGVYSASSVLPKGIMMMAMPILQVFFPTVIGSKGSRMIIMYIVAKGFVATLTATLLVAAILHTASDLVCGSSYGLISCDPDLFNTMLFSIPPLAGLRVLVLYQVSKGHDFHPMLLAIPVLVLTYYSAGYDHSMSQLATNFMIFGYAAFVFYTIVSIPALFFSEQSSGDVEIESRTEAQK